VPKESFLNNLSDWMLFNLAKKVAINIRVLIKKDIVDESVIK